MEPILLLFQVAKRVLFPKHVVRQKGPPALPCPRQARPYALGERAGGVSPP